MMMHELRNSKYVIVFYLAVPTLFTYTLLRQLTERLRMLIPFLLFSDLLSRAACVHPSMLTAVSGYMPVGICHTAPISNEWSRLFIQLTHK
jgi:hypothetical protein